MTDVIKDLHDSEINGAIEWFYDDLWLVKIGGSLAWTAEATLDSYEAAINWLRDKAIELYPGSEFAKKHGRGFV
jgi:hypothetical protein